MRTSVTTIDQSRLVGLYTATDPRSIFQNGLTLVGLHGEPDARDKPRRHRVQIQSAAVTPDTRCKYGAPNSDPPISFRGAHSGRVKKMPCTLVTG